MSFDRGFAMVLSHTTMVRNVNAKSLRWAWHLTSVIVLIIRVVSLVQCLIRSCDEML